MRGVGTLLLFLAALALAVLLWRLCVEMERLREAVERVGARLPWL